MRNLVPARALARRSRNLTLFAILVLVLGILSVIVGSFLGTIPFVTPDNPNYDFYILVTDLFPIVGTVLIIVSILMFIRAFTWKRDNLIAEQIGEVLEHKLNLDDRYVYIRNLSRFSIGYVDAVLIGPPGVLVMRITNKGGVYYNEGDLWSSQRDKDKWRVLRWSPSKEAVKDVESIRDFLQARNFGDVPVYGVVIFTEDQPATRVTTKQPVVPVIQPFEMDYSLEDSYFADRNRLDQLTVNNVIKTVFG